MIEEIEFIDFCDIDRYRAEGWEVKPCCYPHGHYRALAVREIDPGEEDTNDGQD